MQSLLKLYKIVAISPKLEATFLTTHYPDVIQREMLAKRVSLKEERIEVTFIQHSILIKKLFCIKGGAAKCKWSAFVFLHFGSRASDLKNSCGYTP
jgi:hypothetical protein